MLVLKGLHMEISFSDAKCVDTHGYLFFRPNRLVTANNQY